MGDNDKVTSFVGGGLDQKKMFMPEIKPCPLGDLNKETNAYIQMQESEEASLCIKDIYKLSEIINGMSASEIGFSEMTGVLKKFGTLFKVADDLEIMKDILIAVIKVALITTKSARVYADQAGKVACEQTGEEYPANFKDYYAGKDFSMNEEWRCDVSFEGVPYKFWYTYWQKKKYGQTI